MKTAEIRLLGQRILLKCDNPDPGLTAEALELVTSRIDAAQRRASKTSLSPHQIILLALLDLAEEYVQAKQRTAQYQAEVRSQAQQVVDAFSEGEAGTS